MSLQQKFIIYGQSRSGSTLLVDLANSHPDITCEGELLQYDWGYIPNKRLCSIVTLYPYPFFHFRRKLAKTSVYGFKLFCFHLRKEQVAIRKLSESGWKIIYLKRNNFLYQAISNLIAFETKHWHTKPGQMTPRYRVSIPISKLEQALKNRERWNLAEEKSLRDIDFLQIDYEKELKDSCHHQQTAEKIFSYLDLDSAPAKSDFQKTDSRPYSEILLNYDEIIEYINDTQYSHMVLAP